MFSAKLVKFFIFQDQTGRNIENRKCKKQQMKTTTETQKASLAKLVMGVLVLTWIIKKNGP